MEAVAEHAGVSRPLVYKHFANRGELLAAVYRRESKHFTAGAGRRGGAPDTLDGMFRTLIRGSLRAAAERGHVFAAAAFGRPRPSTEPGAPPRRRSPTWTPCAPSRRGAVLELGIERRQATATTATLFWPPSTPCSPSGAFDPHRSTPRLLLEDIYMGMVSGAYKSIPAASTKD